MALFVEKTTSGLEYKVKDMSQADFGRLEIKLAEVKMPGLMACRIEFGPSQPFKGARISGSLLWCSCNIFSTQDHAASAIARDYAAVFAWKVETLQAYWWCIDRCLDWGVGGGPDLIVDDVGDATLLIHEGVKAEEEYEKTGKLPDPASTDNADFQIVLGLIRDRLKSDPKRFQKMKQRLVGVSEETTINVNDSVTKSKGCGPSCLEQGYVKLREKTTHHPNLEVEGEGNERRHTIINFSDLSTDSSFSNQSQGAQTNEPATCYLISILREIFPSLPINNHNTTRYLTTLEAKEILAMGFAALIALLSVSYRINGHGNLVPTALFHQPTFTFFLIIIMISVYFPAIGIILQKAFPMITKVLNAISFVSIVLGVTVLLRALVPYCASWIPWIFFACAVVAAFGVIVYGALVH